MDTMLINKLLFPGLPGLPELVLRGLPRGGGLPQDAGLHRRQ